MSKGLFEGARARLLCGTALAAAGVVLTGSSIALAQTPATEVVTVTGSRLAVDNAYDSPTPLMVIGADDIKMSGTVNIESLLNQSPQFVGATNGGPSSNTQQANGASGGAYINLRGLGEVRSLVLVNGRRFTINGTNQTTDLNTIPTALVDRTEIVTGGSSAVYGSDAIAGVVNFVMKQNYSGARIDAHSNFDSDTGTPTYSVDITAGANFDHDRGNIAVSMDYLNRGGIIQRQVSYAVNPLNESCVTTASFSKTLPGVANGASAANCASSGGIMGFTAGGSTSTPDGQFIPFYTGSDPTLTTPTTGLYALAGLGGLNGNGFTFNDGGTTARLVNNPTDLYNTTALNFMQIPQERWMINSFAHYDILPWLTAYAEMHFSNNIVNVQLTPSNLGGQSILVDTNNPYLSPAVDAVLVRLDQLETGTTSITEGSKVFTTTPNDGVAILKMSRRFVELGNRTDSVNRSAWRFVGGFKGDIGSVSDNFLKDLSYDVYYDYARTQDTNFLTGVGSRSAIQNAILRAGGAAGPAPVCDVFGATMTPACIAAVGITDSYTTKAEQAGAVATVTGKAFELPAGPVAFDLGLEWRFDSAQYIPDPYLATGEPTGFNGSLPTKGSESVNEIFGEVRVPVLADLPLIEKFTVNGAFRNSSYNLSGVGSVWTYSAGGDWKVTDDVAFRGQFQHAIRAPNVGELFGGTALNFASATIDPCGSNQVAQTTALRNLCVATGVPTSNVFTTVVQDASKLVGNQTGGNPNLKAEASDTITFGTVLTPTFVQGLSLSIDYYSVNVKGAIAPFGGSVAGVLNSCYLSGNTDPNNQNCLAIHRDSSGAIAAPGYINLGQTNLNALKVEGIDFGGDYAFDPGWSWLTGSSSVTISSDWTLAMEDKSTSSTPGALTANCVGAFGGTCGEPFPRWKGVSRVTYHDGPLSVSLRWRLLDSVTNDRYLVPLRGGPGTLAPLATITNPVIPIYNYFDLSGSYDVSENLTVSAGVNNLFNLTPPVVINSAYGNTWPATYDAFGQTLFINITAKTD